MKYAFIAKMLSYIWSCIISYVVKRATGSFMDSLFDTVLKEFAKATPSKVDDELVNIWINKKEDK